MDTEKSVYIKENQMTKNSVGNEYISYVFIHNTVIKLVSQIHVMLQKNKAV